MIPELGHFALILALCLAVVQAIVPLRGSFTHNSALVSLANFTAYGQFLFIMISFSILMYAFIINDFSLAYVAQNSNTKLPLLYRLCAVWGAHEGSLLLWVFILSIWGVLVACFNKAIPREMVARVLSIMALISIGFLLFLLTTSNPFARILPNIPLQGRDLNPLLQDPGLAIHPPMLYVGYVGFAVPFAFAVAALISGKFDAAWARFGRPWTLIAWSFLTFGITLGSWWAYRVLGWGGWWFWDPVENASFLPWLSGTALIHSLLVAEKRNTFKAWTILLAVCTFSLSLMGTFLVRSGILVSVHSFAVDPARGSFMLYFLTIVVGGSLALYAWRGHTIKNSGVFQFWSRETMLLSNNMLLITATLTVLLGTLYPLIIEGLGLGKLSVGPPYFNAVFLPLMTPVLFLMGIGPALHWQNSKLSLIVPRFKYSLALSLIVAALLPLLLFKSLNFQVLLGLFLGFWVIFATIQANSFSVVKAKKRFLAFKMNTRRLGMLLAHLGFALAVIGITITTANSVQQDIRLNPNDTISIGPYKIVFNKVSQYQGPNYAAYKGDFSIEKGRKIDHLQPELRVYQAQSMSIAKTAIKVRPLHDLYIALGEPLAGGAWSMRVYYKPFVRFIWLGGLMMMVGAIVAAIRLRPLNKLESVT